MHDGVGIGIIRIDTERLRQPRAVGRLDRGEAESLLDVACRDEANPARAEDAHAVVEDHVIVGPSAHRLSNVNNATSISTTAGPGVTRAPRRSLPRAGRWSAAPIL